MNGRHRKRESAITPPGGLQRPSGFDRRLFEKRGEGLGLPVDTDGKPAVPHERDEADRMDPLPVIRAHIWELVALRSSDLEGRFIGQIVSPGQVARAINSLNESEAKRLNGRLELIAENSPFHEVQTAAKQMLGKSQS